MDETTALDVLRNYWDRKLPVNPAAIARKMGVELKGDPDLSYSGHYHYNSGSPVITYKAVEYRPRLRFTIAHELGHHVNGDIEAPRDDAESFSARSRDPIEVAANQFAAALLMPEPVVKYLIREQGVTDLDDLADRFGVSTVAMQFRLRNLGLI